MNKRTGCEDGYTQDWWNSRSTPVGSAPSHHDARFGPVQPPECRQDNLGSLSGDANVNTLEGKCRIDLRCAKVPSRSAAGKIGPQTNVGINASYIAVDNA